MPTIDTADKFSVYFGESGLTLTTTLSKAGGAFSAVAPTIVDAENGYYIVTPLAAHRDTLGVNSWLFVAGDDARPFVESVTAALVTPLNATQTQAAAAAALTAYDPPTRAEATADKDEVIGAIDAIGDSDGVGTLLERITDTIQTKTQADTDQAAVLTAIAGNSLTGPNEVTITIVDQDTSEPIEGARVRLFRTGSAATESKPTNVDGEAQFTVESYTWLIAVSEGTHNGASGSIVVPTELTKTISMTSTVVTPSTDPATSNVTARVINQSGTPMPGVVVTAKIKSKQALSGTSLAINVENSETTNSNGEVVFELIRSVELSGNGLYEFTFGYERQKYKIDHFVKDQASDTATLRIVE